MKDIYHIACCPYCPAGRGDIALDSSAIMLSPPGNEGAPHATSEPPRPLVLYNLAQADRQPCEHLVQLTGSIQVRGEQPPEERDHFCGAEFDWHAADLSRHVDAMSYLWNYLIEQADAAPAPRTPFTYQNVERNCEVFDGDGEDDFVFAILGNVIFAQDVRQLLAELDVLAESLGQI